jgi:hypothetical protein
VARNGLDARTDYSVVMMCLFATSSPDVGTGVSRLRWTTPRGPVPSLRPGPPPPRVGPGRHLAWHPIERRQHPLFADWLAPFANRSGSFP